MFDPVSCIIPAIIPIKPEHYEPPIDSHNQLNFNVEQEHIIRELGIQGIKKRCYVCDAHNKLELPGEPIRSEGDPATGDDQQMTLIE